MNEEKSSTLVNLISTDDCMLFIAHTVHRVWHDYTLQHRSTDMDEKKSENKIGENTETRSQRQINQ